FRCSSFPSTRRILGSAVKDGLSNHGEEFSPAWKARGVALAAELRYKGSCAKFDAKRERLLSRRDRPNAEELADKSYRTGYHIRPFKGALENWQDAVLRLRNPKDL